MRAIDADALEKILEKIPAADIKNMGGQAYVLVKLSQVFNVIDNQPTIEPEPHWIPCSERMPEESEWIETKEFSTTISDEVYVTIEVSSGKRITRHMCFENGSIPAFEQRSIDVFYKGGKAVAWMPLPEAYREGKG